MGPAANTSGGCWFKSGPATTSRLQFRFKIKA